MRELAVGRGPGQREGNPDDQLARLQRGGEHTLEILEKYGSASEMNLKMLEETGAIYQKPVL